MTNATLGDSIHVSQAAAGMFLRTVLSRMPLHPHHANTRTDNIHILYIYIFLVLDAPTLKGTHWGARAPPSTKFFFSRGRERSRSPIRVCELSAEEQEVRKLTRSLCNQLGYPPIRKMVFQERVRFHVDWEGNHQPEMVHDYGNLGLWVFFR